MLAKALANVLTESLDSGTYNLVDRSLKVMDIVDELKQLIPDLEFILINQHIKLNQLVIQVNETVRSKLGIQNTQTLKSELREFLQCFSF